VLALRHRDRRRLDVEVAELHLDRLAGGDGGGGIAGCSGGVGGDLVPGADGGGDQDDGEDQRDERAETADRCGDRPAAATVTVVVVAEAGVRRAGGFVVYRRAKLDVLTRLERCTKDVMRPALERRGIDTAPAPTTLDTAATFADAAAAMPWRELLASFEPTTAKYVAVYEALGAAGEDPALVALLLQHERALAEFARRELAGETATSTRPILELPHVAARATL
jgi:hypothetical protein